MQRCNLGLMLILAGLMCGLLGMPTAHAYLIGDNYNSLQEVAADAQRVMDEMIEQFTAPPCAWWTNPCGDDPPIWQGVVGQDGPAWVPGGGFDAAHGASRTPDWMAAHTIRNDHWFALLDAILDPAACFDGLPAETVEAVREAFEMNKAQVLETELIVPEIWLRASVLTITINRFMPLQTGSNLYIDAQVAEIDEELPSLFGHYPDPGSTPLLEEVHPQLRDVIANMAAAYMTLGDQRAVDYWYVFTGRLAYTFVQDLLEQIIIDLLDKELDALDEDQWLEIADKIEKGELVSDAEIEDDWDKEYPAVPPTNTLPCPPWGDVLGLDVSFTMSLKQTVNARVRIKSSHVCQTLVEFASSFNCTDFVCLPALLGLKPELGDLNGDGVSNIDAYNAAVGDLQQWLVNVGADSWPFSGLVFTQDLGAPAEPVDVYGNPFTLEVEAVTPSPAGLVYQWYAGTALDAMNPIPGATDASLDAVVDVYSWDGVTGRKYYQVQAVSGTCDVWSSVYVLDGPEPPEIIIVEEPESFEDILAPGVTVDFTVVAEVAAGNLVYQWERFFAGAWFEIEGATDSTLVLSNITEDDSGEYRVRVSLDMEPAPLYWIYSKEAYMEVLPRSYVGVDTHPVGAVLDVGDSHEMHVLSVMPEGDVAYRWQRDTGSGFETLNDWSPDNETLLVENVTLADAGVYRAQVQLTYSPEEVYQTNSATAVITVNTDAVFRVDRTAPGLVQDGATWETAFLTIQPAINAASAAGGGQVWVAGGSQLPESQVGILGSYYYSNTPGAFSTLVATSWDPQIDFDWGVGAPDPLPGRDDLFAIRWEGHIEVSQAGMYTFYSVTDDGARLYINNQQIINAWVDQGPTEHSGSISLQPGVHEIRFEYYENTGGASCRLLWSGPGVPKQIIPTSAFVTPTEQVFTNTYNEPRPEMWRGASGALIMKSNVGVFGGFSGWSGGAGLQEYSRAQRARSQNVTVIDGSASRGTGRRAFNVVVFGEDVGGVSNSTLDGVVVTGGYAVGVPDKPHTFKGGGIYVHQSSPAIVNCWIMNNRATLSGGGIAIEAGDSGGAYPMIMNSIIADNHADRANIAGNPQRGGGGVSIFGNELFSADASLIHATIVNNTIGNAGYTDYGANTGGLYAWNASPVIINSILWGNAPGGMRFQQTEGLGRSLRAIYTNTQAPFFGAGNTLTNPMLNAAQAPQPGSPMIDSAYLASTAPDDIRGVYRPLDGGTGEALPDRGAVEVSLNAPVVVCLDPQPALELDIALANALDLEDIVEIISIESPVWRAQWAASGPFFDCEDLVSAPDPSVYPVVVTGVYDVLGRLATVNCSTQVSVFETEPPVLVVPPSPWTVQCDLGAEMLPEVTAFDNCDGELPVLIDYDGFDPDNPAAGVYELTFSATDSSGNYSEAGLTLEIADNLPPVIDLNGPAEIAINAGEAYVDAATAWDNCDGDVTGNMDIDYDGLDPGDPQAGVYTLTYTVSDIAGNDATPVTRTVTVIGNPFVESVMVVDELNVAVTFSGPMGANASLPSNYNVAGSGRGNLSLIPVSVSTEDNITYVLQWACPDHIMVNGGDIEIIVSAAVLNSAGNPMTEPRSGIHVGGAVSAMPSIALVGPDTMSVQCGTVFTDPGAIARDACNSVLPVTVGGDVVNPNLPGVYVLTYNAMDVVGQPTPQVVRTVNVVDTEPPVIVLDGDAVMTISCSTTFTEPGYTAIDMCEGDISAAVQVDGAVNSDVPGTYVLTYTVSDAFGNAAAPVTRTVNVTAPANPTITLVGDVVSLFCGQPYEEPGYSAEDACGNDLTGAVIVSGAVDHTTIGSYTLFYNVQDAVGNAAAEQQRTVHVAAQNDPVITLNGSATVNVECNTAYTDAGATAVDDCGDDISGAIVVGGLGDVDTSVVGASYVITYDVQDANGNDAAQVTRTVNIVDNTPPVVTLDGDAVMSITCLDDFVEPGYSAVDTCDGPLPVTVEGDVDTTMAGTYILTYSATDSSDNTGTATRTVHVTDTDPPVLSLIGDPVISWPVGKPYNYEEPGEDGGATATDSCDDDGELTASIVIDASQVNVLQPGVYTVYFDVTDRAGNPAATITRTVHVMVGVAPFVLDVEVDSDHSVLVSFCCSDMGGDGNAAAMDPDNYLVWGDGAGTLDSNPMDVQYYGNNTYRLVWDCPGIMLDGGDVIVSVFDVEDDMGTPIGYPNFAIHAGGGQATAPSVLVPIPDVDYRDRFIPNAITASSNITGPITNIQDNPTAPDDLWIQHNTGGTGELQTSFAVEGTYVNIEGTQTFRVRARRNNTSSTPGFTARLYEGNTLIRSWARQNVTTTGSGTMYSYTWNRNEVGNIRNARIHLTLHRADTGGTAPTYTYIHIGAVDWVPNYAAPYYAPGATIEVPCAQVITSIGDEADGMDACDNPVPAPISDAGGLDMSSPVPGMYTVTYTATDGAGNTGSSSINVEVTGSVPVVTIDPPDPLIIGCDPIDLPAASAMDECDGPMDAEVYDLGGYDPDNLAVGNYTVTYRTVEANSSGEYGYATMQVQVPGTVPVVTIDTPASPLIVGCDAFDLPGASAVDACDGPMDVEVYDLGGLTPGDPSLGTYTVTYRTVEDNRFGAYGVATLQVIVQTDLEPEMVPPYDPFEWFTDCGMPITLPTVQAYDACGLDISGAVSVTPPAGLNMNAPVPGEYTVLYTVTDANGNVGSIEGLMTVVDTLPPIVTLIGDPEIYLGPGQEYEELGVTAFDDCEVLAAQAQERIRPSAIAAMEGSWVGTVARLRDDPTDPDDQWMTTVEIPTAVLLLDFDPPSGWTNIAGTQTFRLRVRNSVGAGNAVLNVRLYENGVELQNFGNRNITTPNPGNVQTYTWNAAAISDPQRVQVRIQVTYVDRGYDDPAYVHIGAVDWLPSYGNIPTDLHIDHELVKADEEFTEWLVTYAVADPSGNVGYATRSVFIAASDLAVAWVTVEDTWNVLVGFNQPVGAGALLVDNYVVSGTGSPTMAAHPDQVTLVDENTARLTWACPSLMTPGGDITVTVDRSLESAAEGLLSMANAATHVAGAIGAPPTIALIGDALITLALGQEYSEQGANVSDACGTLLPEIEVSIGGDVVDTSKYGVYVVEYDAVDGHGLAAETVTRTVQVTAEAPLTLISDLTDAVVLAGEDRDWSIEVSGGAGVLTYQWFYSAGEDKAFVPIEDGPVGEGAYAGTDTNTLSIVNMVEEMAGLYQVEVTDEVLDSVVAGPATLYFSAGPLAAQLADAVVVDDADYDWSVEVIGGTDALSYQWYRYDDDDQEFVALEDGAFGDGAFSGVATDTLSIIGMVEEMEGQYQVEVHDALTDETAIASALLTYSTGLPLTVVRDLMDANVVEGDDFNWSIEVTGGTGALSYQWYRETGGNFVPLSDGPFGDGAFSGTTTDTLSIENMVEEMEGRYQVEVSDSLDESIIVGPATLFFGIGVPAAGALGLAAVALAAAIGGAMTLRRRRK